MQKPSFHEEINLKIITQEDVIKEFPYSQSRLRRWLWQSQLYDNLRHKGILFPLLISITIPSVFHQSMAHCQEKIPKVNGVSVCLLRPVVPQILVSSLDNIYLLHLYHPKAPLLLLLKQKQIIACIKPWVMKKHLLLVVVSSSKENLLFQDLRVESHFEGFILCQFCSY